MKREIKFRAQELGSGEWVYGDLIHKRTAPGEMMIRQRNGMENDVDAETIGQYTGVKDKAGNQIYEGDIICSRFHGDKPVYHVVIWDENSASFRARLIKQGLPFDCCGIFQDWIDRFGKEVVGNIFDNKEFLEEE